MRFFHAFVGTVALISSAVAQSVSFTNVPTSVEAGRTYVIEYNAPAGQSVSIILRKGNPDDLDTITTLTSDSTGGSFSWTVPSNLESDNDYAFEIRGAGGDNFSGQFSLSGGSGSTTSSSSASATSSASASASTSASASASSSESSTITASASLSSAASSLSSLISAANSTLASLTSINATITSSNATATPSSNSTTTLRTSTATSTATESSRTGGSATASSTGGAPTSGASMPNMASPVALILGAVAAIVFLN
ncbi:Cell wall beta-glucan synthesis [Macrophomina phaseolina MS6]|uniref:Cell wall beta-glucan synthesis n=1 Tax=Macrophomina phaseolina (strain MS6) TaxID=1126212 RepID=K2SB30_MACPH|nr:Cell wall beta-glucan synthesis [Macrophomina phaseolina MS6]